MRTWHLNIHDSRGKQNQKGKDKLVKVKTNHSVSEKLETSIPKKTTFVMHSSN